MDNNSALKFLLLKEIQQCHLDIVNLEMESQNRARIFFEQKLKVMESVNLNDSDSITAGLVAMKELLPIDYQVAKLIKQNNKSISDIFNNIKRKKRIFNNLKAIA